jgi:O-6-methylguanine DNA methyltransferase
MIEWVFTWETPAPFGWAILFGSKRGAKRFDFGFKTKEDCLRQEKMPGGETLREMLLHNNVIEHSGPRKGPAWLFPSVVAITRYLNGEKVKFDIPLDWSEATDFQKSVWRATMKIPHGKTRSYGWVADNAGSPRATRAAGSALGANPLPIIVPCHRVLRAGGALGGFAMGTVVKQLLLELERS